MKRFRVIIGSALVVAVCALFATQANATAQWTRKYKTSCNTCHDGFPRLNWYGERFMANGYQDPDKDIPDGDTTGKTRINETLVSDSVENYFGVRFSYDPFVNTKNGVDIGGGKTTDGDIGETVWIEPFIAGSINKNISIFIEMEIDSAGKTKYSWNNVKFTNLYGTLVNFMVGNQSPLEWASFSNRLRIFAATKADPFNMKMSKGAGADSFDMSSARGGISYYGYKGPLIWWAGAAQGDKNPQNNNNWAGVRATLTEDIDFAPSFEGSGLTLWAMKGKDSSANFQTNTNIAYNNYLIISPQFNIRWNGLDLQAAYFIGTEDDQDLNASTATEEKWKGYSLQAQYILDSWFFQVGLDKAKYESQSEDSANKVYAGINKAIVQNFRIGGYYEDDNTKDDKDKVFVNMRTMF